MDELFVTQIVGMFADHYAPGDEALAADATDRALVCLAGGASASEAAAEGRRVIEQRTRLVPVPG